MIPYTTHHVTAEDEKAVLDALRSGYLTQGPVVERFEESLALLAGCRYAVCVSSGTAALHLAYLTVDWERHLPEVSMPAISFVATANMALLTGRRPLFRDVDPVTGRTPDGEVYVTLGGVPIPQGRRYHVVDACHGPIQHHPQAQATVLSFHPAKHMACGEGGAILTNDPKVAEDCRALRSHGRVGIPQTMLGFNYRMPEMNAALGLSQLVRYQWGVQERRRLAATYDTAFAFRGVDVIPHSPDSARHLYSILVDHRDQVQAALRARGILTAVHYPVIPLQPYYRQRFGFKAGQWPNAERFAARTLSLPLYPTLREADQMHVIESVLAVV